MSLGQRPPDKRCAPRPQAGEGEDGRMKSAIGIGSLLMDGLGDTFRVSLTEDPEKEIDPCKCGPLSGPGPERRERQGPSSTQRVPLLRDGSAPAARWQLLP